MWGRGFPGAGKKRQPQATCCRPLGPGKTGFSGAPLRSNPLQIEPLAQTKPPGLGDPDRPARRRPLNPSQLQQPGEERGAEGAGEVAAALAPVEAGAREGPP